MAGREWQQAKNAAQWATNLARTSTAAAASGIDIAQTQMKVTQELRKQGLKHLAAPATPQSTS
jgi:hypothetical protein